MVKVRKIEWVESLTEDIRDAANMVFTDFSGIEVSEMENLRSQLYEKGSRYRVVKNRLAKLAFDNIDSGSETDVEPEEKTVEEETQTVDVELGDLPGIGESKVTALAEIGIKSVAEAAAASLDKLQEASGIGASLAEKLSNAAREVAGEPESTEQADVSEPDTGSAPAAGLADQATPFLAGNTAIVFNDTDIVATAKVLVDFAEKNESLVVKGGFLDERPLTAEEIIELSKLPTRRELLTKLAIGLNSPMRKLAQYLINPLQKLVWALNKVKEKQEDSKE